MERMANIPTPRLEEALADRGGSALSSTLSSPAVAAASGAIPSKLGFQRNQVWSYFGPAFVASVAYIDPGNFATNIEGGSRFGYRLLWVLLWSNAMAILIQYLSAKLGIVTGLTLPQNCRKHFSR
ncbi:MAG TPA: Nramp family divalent metal transporter, partial [Rhizobacter sp.]|nr:Nramp family divalent metal transporter [Rhizobacter sp.]